MADLQASSPECPARLIGAASDKWRETRDILLAQGKTINGTLLEMYADAYAGYAKCQEMLQTVGHVIADRDKNGNTRLKKNAFADEAHRYRDALLQLADQLGIGENVEEEEQPRLYNVKDVAKYLGTVPDAVQRWKSQYDFFPERRTDNGKHYWYASDLDEFVKRGFMIFDQLILTPQNRSK